MNKPANPVSQLMNAFELANIEALAVLLPEATITELTTAAIRKWNCARSDLVGRQLVKYGTGTLSARYLAAHQGEQYPDVEVTYAPPLAVQKASSFKQQKWSDGTSDFMILIGQHANEEQATRPSRTSSA